MKIIILGAGRVGQAVAESLVLERNDVTLIDKNAQRVREIEQRFDLRGVIGNGIDPEVLSEAGADDTDLLIACASEDETNLVCCKVAHMIFNIPSRIARLRERAWMGDSELLSDKGFAVSYSLRPEDALMRYLIKLVHYPQAMQVRNFAGGAATMASVRAIAAAPMVSRTIGEIRALMPNLTMRILAIYRRFADQPDRFIQCNGDTRIEPDDEVFVIATKENIAETLTLLSKPVEAPLAIVRRIMIVDAGIVALKLAQELTKQRKGYYVIKVVERDAKMCAYLSEHMPPGVLLLKAEATQEEFLEQENIESIDLLMALSNDDEGNIMACLLAKRMGAKRVAALINKRSYADLMHGTQIDIALTPAQAMLGEVLTYVRHGDVQAVHRLRRGVAEALEIVVRGTDKTSRVVGKKVGDLKLPRDVRIGVIARGLNTELDLQRVQQHLPKNSATDDSLAYDKKHLQGETVDITAISEHSEPESDNTTQATSNQVQNEVQIIFPNQSTVIQPNDHIVFFLPHQRLVREVEKTFAVKPTFF